jgi:hypothetical protein
MRASRLASLRLGRMRDNIVVFRRPVADDAAQKSYHTPNKPRAWSLSPPTWLAQ